MKYKLHQNVYIIALSFPGRVLQINYSCEVVKYEIRYFWNGEMKSGWFYEDELKELK